jgi:hypothetical protein
MYFAVIEANRAEEEDGLSFHGGSIQITARRNPGVTLCFDDEASYYQYDVGCHTPHFPRPLLLPSDKFSQTA